MKFLNDFITQIDLSQATLYPQLKCSLNEARILQYLTIAFLRGDEDMSVRDVLIALFGQEKEPYAHLEHIYEIRHLLELGWLSQVEMFPMVLSKVALLELLSTNIALSSSFLKLLEVGEVAFNLPEIAPYDDHLEYLKDQFQRIDLLSQICLLKENHTQDSPSLSSTQSRLEMLETRIDERLKLTHKELSIEQFFREYGLSLKERTLFLALLKEEYSDHDERIRDMNSLLHLISDEEVDRIKNRSLLDEHSLLLEKGLVDYYEEVVLASGYVTRTFFIPEEILYKITHPKKRISQKNKFQSLLKEQDVFECVETNKTMSEIVLSPTTEEILQNLMRQVNLRVLNRLKMWGVRDKKGGIEAKIIFYGPAGTGKTITAKALAKSLKRPLISLDCSKILSLYVGESEKNVRKIFDTYYDIVNESKIEPILLLDEADQFLSMRTQTTFGGAEKMHNQMQNIFLEQIEKFRGILIATTNLLESIDSAFSRRFNYKIEFKKPNEKERLRLWEGMLPRNAHYEKGFSLQTLARYPLTGGQIRLVIQNTAYKVAVREEPIFLMQDFLTEIQHERNGNFDSEKIAGFLG
ncbi:MAG: ATP-binding protein [Helicobacter sp.]|nr:ATP-binding protein [Helicobacter sp.]